MSFSGRPSDETRLYRNALGQFATGVALITWPDEMPAGMIVNSFTSISLEPALIGWSIKCESANLARLRAAGRFGVSVLAQDQLWVSQQVSTRKEDKFRDIALEAAPSGQPLLQGALAQFDCRLVQEILIGDHLMLIGQVDYFKGMPQEPLLFLQGGYAARKSHPALTAAA